MRPTRRHAYLTAATAIAVVVVVLAGTLQPGVGATQPTEIDLTGPVRIESCSPCHQRIAESRDPGLVFAHDAHATVDCSVCHVRSAHEGGATHVPPMETCFACHGLVHGSDGVMAADSCDTCHTQAFELRPADHSEDWTEEPHAGAVERGGSNGCMMCHEARAHCDACHREQGVDTPLAAPGYLRNVPLPESRPPLTISVDGPVTMGQCVFCHPDIDRSEGDGLLFTHAVHFERDYDCEVCHERFPHRAGATDRPDMSSCYRCHGVQHTEDGEAAPDECGACHPPGFELVPADHTAAFIASSHRKPGAEDLLDCTTCHASAFCAECHRSEKRLPDGSYSKEVIPDDHQTAAWMAEHGEPFLLSGEATCSICHTNESCSRCHPTVMPHPTTWLASHTSSGFMPDDCGVCHSDRNWCQECHHDPDRSQELRAENCVNCHPEMRRRPSEIKVAKLAEHAAHFDVEEHVGRPHRCDDCHLKLTAARVQHAGQQSAEIGGHDIRICYDCHGAADSRGDQIAPWPGSDLCKRCHTGPHL